MTAPTETAAPIPADVLALAAEAVHAIADAMPIGTHRQYIIARAILADREARPSLRDSREEQIRQDVLDRQLASLEAVMRTQFPADWVPGAIRWLLNEEGAMLPADRARARQGGNNG